MCLEQLMTQGLLSGEGIVYWISQATELRNMENEIESELSMSLTSMAVSHTADACQQFSYELSTTLDELQYARNIAEEASQIAAAAQARSEGDSSREQAAAEREREALEKVTEIEKQVLVRREALETAVGRQNTVAAEMLRTIVLMTVRAKQEQEQEAQEDSKGNLWLRHCVNLTRTMCRKFHVILAPLLPVLLQQMEKDQIPADIQQMVKQYVRV
eukprot:TRINITY_DN1813_c3_g1_i2.p3 TRINITY_DN1813_c3_g1~~TRINITY_DN1813_c3_g1_i2.p3  ORF type:complete len:216 (-),score=21.50 TRINITY_DN1813_c3_g1_i2:269-916(-)